MNFVYPRDFEEVWSFHPYGVKKLAYDQWLKLAPPISFKDTFIDYLKRRHRDDKGWSEGKIHHLRTILSQRHWEVENYERKARPKLVHASHADFAPSGPLRAEPPTERELAYARAQLMQTGLFH